MSNNDRFRVRIWDKSFRKMLYNNLILCYKNKITAYDYLDNAHKAFLPESHIIIEQCTGLKDKNGKLIYEGDVVRGPLDNDGDFGKITWNNKDGCWFIKYSDTQIDFVYVYAEKFEVIGNIHENPELLGAQK